MDDKYKADWYYLIIRRIPETAYKYVGSGTEPDGSPNLVLVLEIGRDEAKMRKQGIKTPDTLPRQALQVLTPGVWLSQDDDSEDLFQLHGATQGTLERLLSKASKIVPKMLFANRADGP